MKPDLKGYERTYLRGLAHHLKPVVLIGQRGMTDQVIKALHEALEQHELIKVKFIEEKTKAEKRLMVELLCQGGQAHLVGMVGHIAILFRPSSDPEKRKIFLPRRAGESITLDESP